MLIVDVVTVESHLRLEAERVPRPETHGISPTGVPPPGAHSTAPPRAAAAGRSRNHPRRCIRSATAALLACHRPPCTPVIRNRRQVHRRQRLENLKRTRPWIATRPVSSLWSTISTALECSRIQRTSFLDIRGVQRGEVGIVGQRYTVRSSTKVPAAVVSAEYGSGRFAVWRRRCCQPLQRRQGPSAAETPLAMWHTSKSPPPTGRRDAPPGSPGIAQHIPAAEGYHPGPRARCAAFKGVCFRGVSGRSCRSS